MSTKSQYEKVPMELKDQVLTYMLDCCLRTGVTRSAILKGAFSLKIALGNNPNVRRATSDLDFDILADIDPEWALTTVSNEICKNPCFREIKRRINTSNPGMGLVFLVKWQGEIFKTKIDFQRTLNDVSQPFRPNTVRGMLADKVKVNLTRTLERRAKDAYDLFIIDRYLVPIGTKMTDLLSLDDYRNYPPSECLYFSPDGLNRIQHAMNKYAPKPVLQGVTSIMQNNVTFLTALYNSLHGRYVYKGQMGDWRTT